MKLRSIILAGAITIGAMGLGGAIDHFLVPRDVHEISIMDIRAIGTDGQYMYVGIDRDQDSKMDFVARYNIKSAEAGSVYVDYNGYRSLK